MNYIQVATGRYPLTLQHLKDENPDVSFPVSFTEAAGSARVEPAPRPDYDPVTHKCREGQPIINAAGAWQQSWVVVKLSAEQAESNRQALRIKAESAVRAERNRRLAACDWTQVADAPANKEAWATYRQALRDVTSQSGFPHSVSWPSEPA